MKRGILVGWKKRGLLWTSGVLTGVCYCTAVTAAQSPDDVGKLIFLASAVGFGFGCISGIFLTITRE